MAYVKKYIGRGDYRTVWEPDINWSVDSSMINSSNQRNYYYTNEDEAIAYANNNLFGADFNSKINPNTLRNTSISNVNPPSDMSTPQQNMNPFSGRNMSPQQVINMAYRLGGGTYEGAVKAARQYGIDLNSIVANRDKARRVSSSPKAQQASSTITNVITETTDKQASAPASISYEGYKREPMGYIRQTTYNYPQKIDIKLPDPVLRAMEKTGYYSKVNEENQA